MTERVTQDKIDRHTRERLTVIVPLLQLLSTQEDTTHGGFTDDGLSTIRAVRIAAWDGAAYLGEEVLGEAEQHHDTSLLWDVQRFLAITACALNGMEVNGAPWIDSPHSVRYLLALGQGLQERAEGDVLGPTPAPADAEEEGAATRNGAFALSSACAALAPVVAISEPFLGERDSAHHVYDGPKLTAEGLDVAIQVVRTMEAALERLEEVHNLEDAFGGDTDLEIMFIHAKGALRVGAWVFRRMEEGEDWNIPGTVAGDLRTALMEFRGKAEEVAHA